MLFFPVERRKKILPSSLVVLYGNLKYDWPSVVRTFTCVIIYPHLFLVSHFYDGDIQVFEFLEDISNSLADSATIELSMLKDLKVRMFFIFPSGLVYFMADCFLSYAGSEKRGRRLPIWS